MILSDGRAQQIVSAPESELDTSERERKQLSGAIGTPEPCLPEHYDILGDSAAVRASELQRLAVHQRKNLSYELAHVTSQRQVGVYFMAALAGGQRGQCPWFLSYKEEGHVLTLQINSPHFASQPVAITLPTLMLTHRHRRLTRRSFWGRTTPLCSCCWKRGRPTTSSTLTPYAPA